MQSLPPNRHVYLTTYKKKKKKVTVAFPSWSTFRVFRQPFLEFVVSPHHFKVFRSLKSIPIPSIKFPLDHLIGFFVFVYFYIISQYFCQHLFFSQPMTIKLRNTLISYQANIHSWIRYSKNVIRFYKIMYKTRLITNYEQLQNNGFFLLDYCQFVANLLD